MEATPYTPKRKSKKTVYKRVQEQKVVRKNRPFSDIAEVATLACCKKSCIEAFSLDDLEKIRTSVDEISTSALQRRYLTGLLRCAKPQRTTGHKRKSGDGRRGGRRRASDIGSTTVLCHVRIGDQEKKVCRTAYQAIFGLSTKRFRTLAAGAKMSGVAVEDKRGKHGKQSTRMVPLTTREKV